MKKITFYIEFIIIFFIMIVSPILSQFQNENINQIDLNYTVPTFIFAIFSIFLYYYERKHENSKEKAQKIETPDRLFNFIVKSSDFFVCFGALCIISVIFQLLASFLPAGNAADSVNFIYPTSVFGIFRFIAGTFGAVFYEETIYRYYLPNSLKKITEKSDKKIMVPIIETFSVLIFASGHIYLGIYGFLNAFFSGCVLRFYFKKTNSIFYGFFAHATYNFFVIFSASLL